MKFKFIEEKIFKVLMKAAAGVILVCLGLILAGILVKGLPAMSLDMITKTSEGGFYLGRRGGILNAIVGSFYLAGGATLLALAVSLPVALYINIYAKKNSRFVNITRLMLNVLWGIPSIVYGAFGFTVMLILGIKTSLLAGIFTVALLVIPIMVRAMDEVLKMIPQGMLDASYSLGATKLQTAFKVASRQALPGIVTAILLAFGRGIGDAASVLFTTGYTDNIPNSLIQPAATLPLAIFFQLSTPFPLVQDRAYGSALILTLIILLISIISRTIARKYIRNRID